MTFSLRIHSYLLPIFFFCLTAPKATGQATGWQWGRGGTGSGIDAYAVAADASGNSYGGGVNFGGVASVFGTITLNLVAGRAQANKTQLSGMRGVYLVAAELVARGFIVSVTSASYPHSSMTSAMPALVARSSSTIRTFFMIQLGETTIVS